MTLSWLLSFDVVPREVFLIDMESFVLVELAKPQWVEGGDLFLTPSSGRYKASHQAFMVASSNLGCVNPYGQGVIRDLADPIFGDEVGAE